MYVPEKKPFCPKIRGKGDVEGKGTDLGLEFEIARQSVSLVLDSAGITELQDHLAKQNTARVHVGHGDDILCAGESG